MKLPQNLVRKSFAVIAVAAVAYLVAAMVVGWDDVGRALASVGAGRFLLVVALSLANYALRFWRWDLFLRALGARIPWRRSLVVYFAAYTMVITPGKIGEVFKAGLLRDGDGVPLSSGLPAVMAERLYDFLAVLALVAAGMAFWDGPLRGLGAGLVVALGLLAAMLLVRSARFRRTLVARVASSRQFADHSVSVDRALLAFGTLVGGRRGTGWLVLSVVAWFCEGAGMAIVCRELAPQVDLMGALFIYGAATLVGSLSFLPGGLGGTEAVIVVLLASVGTARPEATAVAFIVRLATLWLAVVVGGIFFLAARRTLFERGAAPAPVNR